MVNRARYMEAMFMHNGRELREVEKVGCQSEV